MKYFKQLFLTLFSLTLLVTMAEAQTVINLASQCNCEVLSGTVAPAPGAPAADAGNLYINTTTGDIFTYDGTAWTAVSEDMPDFDWLKVGTTLPPTSIADDITTNGRVGIGVPSPLQDLHVAGNLRTDARTIYFGPTQRITGNNGTIMYFNSNHPTQTKLLLRDSDNVFYGGIVGTDDGLNLGLNDKDNDWTFRSVHDQFLTMSISGSEKARILANGRMGIGTGAPTSMLDVNGDARIRAISAGVASDEVVVVNATGLIRKIPRTSLGLDNSPTNELPLAGNDIDITAFRTVHVEPVLDFVNTINSPLQNLTMSAGGNIFMRAWFDGHVGVGNLPNSLTPDAGLHVAHNDGVIAEGTFGSGQSLSAGAGTRMVWSSKHAAFRAGNVNGAQWDDANIGNYSAAFGFSTTASGGFSFAGGSNTLASGDYSFAHGISSKATGVSAIAMGNNAEAAGINSLAIGRDAEAATTNAIALGQGTVSNGNSTIAIGYLATASGTGSKTFGAQTLSTGFNAIAMGEHLFARSRGEISIGSYATDYTPASVNSWNANDRIFSVGIGKDSMNRSNALTMFKSGLSRFDGNALIVTNSSLGSEALFIDNLGTGVGQTIAMKNATSNAAGQYITQKGLGIGLNISMDNAASNRVGIRLFQNGLATAQDIVMNNSASTANGLYLRHNGLGNGQQIVMINAAGSGKGLEIVNNGTGAGLFINQPTLNTNAAVFNSGNVVANEIGGNYDFRVESDTRTHAFWVDANENIANFGSSSSLATSNGTLIGTTTVDYVADFDKGTNTGTAIGIGSIEFLLDGVAETTINNSFSPATYIDKDLGFSPTERAWDDVYADDYVNVSDRREKENIQDITYGLSEIMNMRSVSYNLINDPFEESKLGLIAQDLLPLIGEVVKTHDYKILDEESGEFELVEFDRMGVKYQQLIPVLIKAIQEQQEQISTQTDTNENLTKENQELKSEIDSINEKLEKIMLLMESKN